MIWRACRSAIWLACGLAWAAGAPAAELSPDDCNLGGSKVAYYDLGYENEKQLTSDCVRQGIPLSGRTDTFALEALELDSDQPLKLQPDLKDGTLRVNNIGARCVSRLVYDKICSRNRNLLQTVWWTGGRCPLPSFYSSFSDVDALNVWLHQMGAGDACSTYSTSALVAPMEIGPGALRVLDLGETSMSRNGSPQLLAGVDIHGMIGAFYNLSNLVVQGDVSISDSTLESLNLSHMVVLGDVRITGGTIEDLGFEDVQVKGDIVVDGVILSDAAIRQVRSTGALIWTNNSYQPKASGETYLFSYDLDVDGKPVISGSQAVATASVEEGLRYSSFLDELETEIVSLQRIRARPADTNAN